MSSTESLVAESSRVVAGEPEVRRRIPWIRIIYVAAIAGTLAHHSLTVEGFATVQNVTNVLNQIRILGNARVGPVFVDIVVSLGILLLVNALVKRTIFGRQIMAIGNDEETAAKVGINTRGVTFWAFVLCGGLAGLGGALAMVQVGSITSFLGSGLEFTAVAVVVLGGISLYGGSGSIMPGVLLGALTLEVVRNGLNQVGADPYLYKIVTGLVIFIAIFAFSLQRFNVRAKSTVFSSSIPG